MSSTKYESIWKILNENNFDVNEFEYADFICILCKKLLIDAKQAPCACKFCTKCIEEYLSNGNSICPGNTNECREESLHMRENISTDIVTNRKISKLKLKCPSNNCSYVDTLMNMEQHLMLCGKPSVVCPYSQIGCSKVSIDRDEISNHLQLESYEHAHLMVEMIENLKNDIGFLTKENILLKEDSDRQQKLIETLEVKIDEMKVTCLNKKSDSFEFAPLNLENDQYNQTNESVSTNDEPYKCNEFMWKLHKFSSVQQMKSIDSDEFYTHPNGYKIQLRMLPSVRMNVTVHGVSIYPNCFRSDNDRYLQWPVKCEITIGIINQRTGLFLVKDTQIVVYYNSDKSRVQPFNFSLNNRLALRKDSLLVKCMIKVIK